MINEGYSYKDLKPLVKECLKRRKSVLVKGHPGVGKSTMAMELAGELGFDINNPEEYIDIRLAQKDPVELCGMIAPNREKRVSEWFRPSWVPVNKPAFIFLDEINAGVTKLHQAAAYQIVLERRVGDWKFHPDTVVMAAGNLEEDNAIVTPMSSALNNRFKHFIMKVDVDAWLDWAARKGLNPSYRAYIAFRRDEALYKNDGSDAFPTPRSNADAADFADIENETTLKRLISSCVGEAKALEYLTFLKVYSRVDVPAIVEKGEFPDFNAGENSAFHYALSFGLADYIQNHGMDEIKVANLLAFFKSGFPKEFQAILMKKTLPVAKIREAFVDYPDFMDYARDFVDLLVDAG